MDFLVKIIGWLVAFCLTMGSSLTLADSQEVIEGKHVLISPQDREKISDWIQGVELDIPKSLSLKGGLVDLSPIITELNRLKTANIDNRLNLINVTNLLQDKYLKTLCEKSNNKEACLDQVFADLSQTMSVISESLRDRDLTYPYNEDHLTKDYKFYLDSTENAREALDTTWIETMDLDLSCPANCSHENWFKMISFSPTGSYYQSLQDKINKQANKACKKQILESMMSSFDKMLFPSNCFEQKKKNELTPRCVDSLKSLETLRKRLSDLMQSIYGEQDSYKTSTGAFCIDCLLLEGKSYLETIASRRNFINSVQEREECLDLKPGEKKRIDPPSEAPYILKRSANGDYEIDFPLIFFASEDYDGTEPPSEVPYIYKNRVQKCLKQANKRMFGPNGEKLKISISQPRPPVKNPKNPEKCPKINGYHTDSIPIGIGSANHRSNSTKYESDIDCPLITHEILHLAGLCDEYKEKRRGLYVDPETGEIVSCNPKDSSPNIKAQCKPKYDCRVVVENSIMSDHSERWEYAEENNKSLLHPGHFKKILYGSCPSKNEFFNQCYEDLAWESSEEKKDCQAIRDKCYKENGLGVNKHEEIEFLESEIEEQKKKLESALYSIANPDIQYYEIDGKKVFLSEIIANPENYEEWRNPYYRRDSAQDKIKSIEEKLEIVKAWPDP